MSRRDGIEIGQTTVAKYMAKQRRPPSQGWRTFISNHAEGIALDLFVVPTLSFRLLFDIVKRGRIAAAAALARSLLAALLECEFLCDLPHIQVGKDFNRGPVVVRGP